MCFLLAVDGRKHIMWVMMYVRRKNCINKKSRKRETGKSLGFSVRDTEFKCPDPHIHLTFLKMYFWKKWFNEVITHHGILIIVKRDNTCKNT